MYDLKGYCKSMSPKLKNVLVAWAASVLVIFVTAHFIELITPPNPWADFFKDRATEKPTLIETFYKFFMMCIAAPFVEEAAFRYVPFSLIRYSKNYKQLVFPVMIGTSVIFGWMHGSQINVMFQGFGGFMLAWVYLKNGHSYLSSVMAHSLWNFTIVVGLLHF